MGAGASRVTSLYRCKGDQREDCGRRAIGAVACYGIVDQGAAFFGSREPVFVLIPTCGRHRRSVASWAQSMWGELAEGMWVVADAIPVLVAEAGLTERVVLAPSMDECVGVRVTA